MTRSVVEIKSAEVELVNGGGLFDPRMGVLDHTRLCATCKQKHALCPGHFGHIVLAKPVFNIMLHDQVKRILKCVCFRCSKLLVVGDQTNKDKVTSPLSARQRWDVIQKLCAKVKQCDPGIGGCGAKQPTKWLADGLGKLKIMMQFMPVDKTVVDTFTQQELSPMDVLRIFQQVSNDDLDIMGINPKWCRPEWLILTHLSVPPPAVRPSVVTYNGQRCEDDLTHKLSDIIKFNNQINEKMQKEVVNEEAIMSLTQLLQYHVATFMDNGQKNLPPSQHRNGRKLKTISDRLKHKEGRIRGNLNGKRVDQSARSVITPDPYISTGELGVPFLVAKTLTVPEEVNRMNIAEMQQLVRAGPDIHPGANYIVKAFDKRVVSLKYGDRKHLVLEFGDVVHRHLSTGDAVLFNRQPSLHKMSMMQHLVRVMAFDTFRMNPTCCSPYNADFDGDEMNVMNPQSIVATCELMDLTAVRHNLLSPKTGNPIITFVQDVLTGLYLLGSVGLSSFVDDKTAANLKMCASGANQTNTAAVPTQRTSEVLFSLLPDLNLTKKHKDLDKHTVNGYLLPILTRDYGSQRTMDFMDSAQRIICRWLMTHGFSCGISDLLLPTDTLCNLQKTISSAREEVDKVLSEVVKGNKLNSCGKPVCYHIEDLVLSKLGVITRETGEVIKKQVSGATNRMINMIRSGAKGNEHNVAQMMCAVGQQNVDGKRIPYGFTHRTLPCFSRYDDGVAARGFVSSSFLVGLNPHEVFFHAVAGREGVIDTAIKTSESGYIQRRLVKALEDLKITHDYSVRNASKSIVQFLYGEDGLDGTRVEKQFIPYLRKHPFPLTDQELQDMYLMCDDEFDLNSCSRLEAHYQDIRKDKEFLNKSRSQEYIQYAIPFQRLLEKAKAREVSTVDKLEPLYVLEVIDQLRVNLERIHQPQQSQQPHFLSILLRAYLSPKQLHHYVQTKTVLDDLALQIQKCYKESIAMPGEMVGIVAAQSIGEDTTQLTLNSFHSCGIAEKIGVTRGIPRMKELLSASKHMKKPSLTVYPDTDLCPNPLGIPPSLRDINTQQVLVPLELKKQVQRISRDITCVAFIDLVHKTSVYWDPISENQSHLFTAVADDVEFMKMNALFEEPTTADGMDVSNWVMRIEMDKFKMLQHDLTMLDIYHKLLEVVSMPASALCCTFSDDNQSAVFRIREKMISISNRPTVQSLKNAFSLHVSAVHVKGIRKVKNSSIRQLSDTWVLDTQGTNLVDVLALPNVDNTRTVSNDVNEILQVFGIEAARSAFLNEIGEVIKDSSISKRHLYLLADLMTVTGSLSSVDRFGIHRNNASPLTKCSFEETTDTLVKAGFFGDLDPINGISSTVIMGKIPPCGTGECNITFDEEKLVDR